MSNWIKKAFCVLFLFIGFSSSHYGYVMLPHHDFGENYFQLFLRYDTNRLERGTYTENGQTFDDDEIMFGYAGLDFSFENLAYNMRIYPLEIDIPLTGFKDQWTWLVHDLHWQLFKDYQYGLFKYIKPGVQVGVVNLGIPKKILGENSIFRDYLTEYYISTEVHLFGNPRLSYLYGKNFNSSNSANKDEDVHVIEYSYDRNSLFLELAYDQTYLGTKIFLTKYKYFEMAFNVNQKVKNGLLAGSTSDSQGLTTTGNSAFHPTVMFSFNMRNPINLKKQKKKKKIMPVAVDEYSFLEMERGLISFYDENYKQALVHYENVKKKYPSFGLVHLRLGNTHYQLENYALARSHWKKALKYNVDNPGEVVNFLKKMENRELEIEEYRKE